VTASDHKSDRLRSTMNVPLADFWRFYNETRHVVTLRHLVLYLSFFNFMYLAAKIERSFLTGAFVRAAVSRKYQIAEAAHDDKNARTPWLSSLSIFSPPSLPKKKLHRGALIPCQTGGSGLCAWECEKIELERKVEIERAIGEVIGSECFTHHQYPPPAYARRKLA